ncbi:conserved hypothetical protein [Echinococcus multilocularis]|uniref:Uncharacterized protein n=1 Tax=Echinococcus multilocularis TaxID=6211 RepID=A0A068Y330_ECHMU|nr:conserved hypothetical protein [Echinococcus multilocularis]
MGNLKAKLVRKPLPPLPLLLRIGPARPGQKRDEAVSQAVEVDFSAMKILVDKCVQIYPEVMEEKTSMESFQPPVVPSTNHPTNEPQSQGHSFTEMFTAMDGLHMPDFTNLMGAPDEELLMDILVDELAFAGCGQDTCVDVEHCLNQLLVDLEEKSLETKIKGRATLPVVTKRMSSFQPTQATVCAKRRRIDGQESYAL